MHYRTRNGQVEFQYKDIWWREEALYFCFPEMREYVELQFTLGNMVNKEQREVLYAH